MSAASPDATTSQQDPAAAIQVVVVNAGLSNPSTTRDIATRVAYAAERHITETGRTAEVHILDLRALAGDLATFVTTMIPTPDLEDARLLVSNADALITATPIFQGSYAGLFKMFFDAFDKHALQAIPVTLVATAGTPRHSMILDYAMRPLLSFLQATVLPTGVFATTGEFGEDSDLQHRIARAGSEISQAIAATRSTPFTAAPTSTRSTDVPDDANASRLDNQAAVSSDFTIPSGGFAALLHGHSGQGT
jgi:FMN reductase